jgi:hypothetical protein
MTKNLDSLVPVSLVASGCGLLRLMCGYCYFHARCCRRLRFLRRLHGVSALPSDEIVTSFVTCVSYCAHAVNALKATMVIVSTASKDIALTFNFTPLPINGILLIATYLKSFSKKIYIIPKIDSYKTH